MLEDMPDELLIDIVGYLLPREAHGLRLVNHAARTLTRVCQERRIFSDIIEKKLSRAMEPLGVHQSFCKAFLSSGFRMVVHANYFWRGIGGKLCLNFEAPGDHKFALPMVRWITSELESAAHYWELETNFCAAHTRTFVVMLTKKAEPRDNYYDGKNLYMSFS